MRNFESFDDIVLDLADKRGRAMDHAFIFGENGSGKTNLVDSLIFLGRSTMTMLPEKSCCVGEEAPDLSGIVGEYRMIGSEEGMSLEFRFEIEGHEATYSLEFDEENRLKAESLDYIVSKNRGNLFRITFDDARLQKSLVSGSYRKEINELIGEYWGEHTFMSILMHEYAAKGESYFSSVTAANIRSFLEYIRSLVVIGRGRRFIPSCREIQLPSGMIPSSQAGDLDRAESVLSKLFSRLCSDIRSVYFQKEDGGDGAVRYKLFFEKRIAGKIRCIPAERESSGIRHLLGILSYLLLCTGGRVVVIDEMDTGVHSLLVSQLIGQCIPDITGQLIATVHATALMANADAPSIFIISIDRNGFKMIASIQSREPPNIKTNVQKRYLEGCYSGIPLAGDIGLKDILESSLENDGQSSR